MTWYLKWLAQDTTCYNSLTKGHINVKRINNIDREYVVGIIIGVSTKFFSFIAHKDPGIIPFYEKRYEK